MKLLTLNCHSWQEENQLEKIKHLAKTIQENDYDIIALQEVSQSIVAGYESGNMKRDNYGLVLLRELEQLGVTDYNIVWGFSHIGYDIYEEGLAILTKHPIVKHDSFLISANTDTTYWKTRKIVSATISFKGQAITCYSCHLGWWNDEEEPFSLQVEQLMNRVKKEELSFLLGDFNNSAHIRNEGYDYLLNSGLYDTYELAKKKDVGTTVRGKIAGWDENEQELRIDLILSNQSINVVSSQVIFNGINKNVISDHFGLEVQISM